jgi:hypothetical protein
MFEKIRLSEQSPCTARSVWLRRAPEPTSVSVRKNGEVIGYFAPNVAPEDPKLAESIEAVLGQTACQRLS